ncbi:hypothetical protein G5V59_05855 [Nocardioides sp. W3-2-3]|uniref:hypothetical protein n=1 Tax=Nocardioides convexus TaxID=2712224 RepID=UPI0024189877|nr:hypothetical protein [Nocardioides convexus]NGZ99931.1 hypothetical protein [Nocardioides convexus]
MTTGPGLHEPLPLLLRRVLRGAVHQHARTERRRRFPTVLHVGIPGGLDRTFEVRPEVDLDLALRVEIVEAMARHSIDTGAVPLVWLTRMAGDTDTEDLAWAAAVGHAAGEPGRAPGPRRHHPARLARPPLGRRPVLGTGAAAGCHRARFPGRTRVSRPTRGLTSGGRARSRASGRGTPPGRRAARRTGPRRVAAASAG